MAITPRRALQLHALTLVLILSMIWQLSAADSGATAAFGAGALLFAVNVWLLVWLGQRLLTRPVQTSPSAGPGGGLLVLLGIKVLLLGAGAYLALVSWHLRADYFVAGLVAGLLALVGLASLAGRAQPAASPADSGVA